MPALSDSSTALHTLHVDRRRVGLYRAHMLVYSLAVLVLLYHRTAASLLAASGNSFSSFVVHLSLLLADTVLAFMWACSQAFRWRPVRRREFPHRLPDPDRHEWPALDVFVCTADPRKEPPASVASTALSMMALDYPAHKLSVYVSDDGGSDVTLFAFMEAARFARHWLPFCREKGVMNRSPEAYFASPDRCRDSESQKMKMMFDAMKENVQTATEKGCVRNDFTISAEECQLFEKWKGFVRNNHPSIIKSIKGWKSVFSDPARPAFLGDAPKSLHDSLSQCKRWIVGLNEVAFSRYSPLTFGTRNASLPMGLGYGYYAFWGIWCIPIITYALLPQLALVNQRSLFPKASEPRIYLCAYLFLAAYGQDLAEFVMSGGSVARWWSDQRMWMIRGVTSFLFGTIEFALNQVGIRSQGFNVTSKVMEEEQRKRYNNEVFDFGIASPFFISLGTTAILSLASLIAGITRAIVIDIAVLDEMFVHLFLAGFITANCLPIYEAMFFRNDGGKMPHNVTLTSIFLAGLLLYVGGFLFNTY